MVLMALRAARPDVDFGVEQFSARSAKPAAPADERTAIYQRALRWLMSFQCKDGGWAAFDKDVTHRWLEDVPFADHNAILDPTCSDLTGRVLELLGKIGFPRNDKRIRRAIKLIQRHAGFRRLVVWPLGRELHLRHVAGAPRPPQHRRRHAPAVDRPRARLAGELPERRRRLGRDLHELRRPDLEGPRPEHALADRVGAHGHHLRDRFVAPGGVRLQEHPPRRRVSHRAAKMPTARGPNPRRPAPASRACSTSSTTCTGTTGRSWHWPTTRRPSACSSATDSPRPLSRGRVLRAAPCSGGFLPRSFRRGNFRRARARGSWAARGRGGGSRRRGFRGRWSRSGCCRLHG